MKMKTRVRWMVGAFAFIAILGVGGMALFVVGQRVNPMHQALDTLSRIQLSERWSHPEMLKIRALGVEAVPDLRRVLREKESHRTRFLLWAHGKWPGITNHVSNFPEAGRLDERRWTACQALQNLGPAGRSAAPELLEIFRTGDIGSLNGASMALRAVGVDQEIVNELGTRMEQGLPENARGQAISILGLVKPPSEKTVKVLLTALKDGSPWVQRSAADTIRMLGASKPEVLTELRKAKAAAEATDSMVVLSCVGALWELTKDKEEALPPTLKILREELRTYRRTDQIGGHGGQSIDGPEMLFMQGGHIFMKLPLDEMERAETLNLLNGFCTESGRIFVRMLLLPAMMHLGLPAEKGLEVCRTGLGYQEDYYRVQAARLMAEITEMHSGEEEALNSLLRDAFVGVRVYAAKAHWAKNKEANEITPVLIEALDRAKHQSYYYPEIQRTALALLHQIGPEAKAAESALAHLKTDPDPHVAKLAADAWESVRP